MFVILINMDYGWEVPERFPSSPPLSSIHGHKWFPTAFAFPSYVEHDNQKGPFRH